MAQFVRVGSRVINLDYVSQVDVNQDGTAVVHCDNMQPFPVAADQAEDLIEALKPPKLLKARLEEVPYAPGLGGAGLPPGYFATPPVATPTPVPEVTPIPEPPAVVTEPVPEVNPEPVASEAAPDPESPAEPVVDTPAASEPAPAPKVKSKFQK